MVAKHLGYLPSLTAAAKLTPIALVAGAAAIFLAPQAVFLQAVVLVAVFGVGLAVTRVVTIDDLRLLMRSSPAEVPS
jgi:hypothetical protein